LPRPRPARPRWAARRLYGARAPAAPRAAAAPLPAPPPLKQVQRVEPEPRGVQVAGELRFPGAAAVERLILDAAEVGRQLDALLVEGADALATEVRNRERELEDDVLTGAWSEMPAVAREGTHVIAGEQHDGEGGRRMTLELLDERATVTGLLVEQDRPEAELHQETRDRRPGRDVPAVHDQP